MKRFVQALLFLGLGLPQAVLAQNLLLEKRVDYYSLELLGKPYSSSPLGEASGIDSDPLVRMDAFDCTTFVETSIALALTRGGKNLTATMNRIRYKDGIVNFQSRNHFTNLDWVKNNDWLLQDLSLSLFPSELQTLETLISKSAWFEKSFHMSVNIEDQKSLIFYLPFSEILQKPDILDRLPSVAVANIVRQGWNRKPLSGTEIDISHQGFLVKKNDGIYFRHASQKYKVTMEQPLLEYIETYRGTTAVGLQILGFKK